MVTERERSVRKMCLHKEENTHAQFAQNCSTTIVGIDFGFCVSATILLLNGGSDQLWTRRNSKINKCSPRNFYKFFESLHRFLGRPSLLVEFVRNHGVHSRIRAGHRCDCIVCTLCIICCLRLCWRSHQSVNLYFAASSSLRQVALCVYSTHVSFGQRLTPTMSLNILLLLVRRSLSVSAHIVQHDDP